ncbi:MAG: hypothetical protein IJH22_02185 [Firmicutes bacterium]|nr:hypothetical protein [Bacillota bacterium]
MKVLDELERLQEDALKNEDLRIKLLATKAGDNPLSCFCRLARSLGYDINEMDLVYAGEEAYAGMRRAMNGGGENSPMLENEDDYYSLFFSAIEKKGR